MLASVLVSGLGLGSMYGLIALGFTLTFVVSGTVNFAQGSSLMLGAVVVHMLAVGEQQMLALARGLLARPVLLLLDEPSLGLAPAVAQELFEALSRLPNEGLSLLPVDQMADLALPLADRCAVLSGGQVGRAGPAAEMGPR